MFRLDLKGVRRIRGWERTDGLRSVETVGDARDEENGSVQYGLVEINC